MFLLVLERVYCPRRKGKVGRNPSRAWWRRRTWFYGQVVKVRDKSGRVVKVVSRVVWGACAASLGR